MTTVSRRPVVSVSPNNPVFDLPIYVARDEGVVEHVGVPERRYEALKQGTSRAVAVKEPFISLGLKEGAHLVDVTFYRGAEVIAPSLTPEQHNAYLGAINEAADRIMADFGKYKHYVT